MSILVKPYEIAVYDDVLINGEFVEQRLGIIGSNNMLYQGRAIEPVLTRNVNGTKSLTFKMYKYFVDNETGERVENPFIGWLINERKVKLKYGTYIDAQGQTQDRWYDFIIKNIDENSADYLYSYQLEDALVQELSKNGFGITLNEQLMNNAGTAKELAEYVLEETDWKVKSEAFVEQVEESLVYVIIPKDTVVYPIKDQSKDKLENGITIGNAKTLENDWKVLAFYSSCTSKPHRFQFIYIPGGYSDDNGKTVATNDKRIIEVDNCQYFCEIDTPNAVGSYVQHEDYSQFYLPKDFQLNLKTPGANSITQDTTISTWYRGKRYGFAQSAKYVPLLERYCNEYTKNGKEYYGFKESKYISPTLVQNIITNADFSGSAGWVGAYEGNTANAKAKYGVIVESTYGRFNNNQFSSVVEELGAGTYSANREYKNYLKVTYPEKDDTNNDGILINTGFFDNRTLIEKVSYNEEWYFNPVFLTESGSNYSVCDYFDFYLREVAFDPTTGYYTLGNIWATAQCNSGSWVFKFRGGPTDNNDLDIQMSFEEFKKKEIKLVIQRKPDVSNKIACYIQKIELFKLAYNKDGDIIKPGDISTDGVVEHKQTYFLKGYVEEDADSGVDVVTNKDDIVYITQNFEDVDYSVFVPLYNAEGQKIRTVTASESNYFNILQNIAETFQAWLSLDITRDENGAIREKTVRFKNYVGKDNYAAFRYGVNLTNIQRAFESKSIVTKLIVKQNNNEHGENGFCTIARANSNPTGESYIYDFQYFYNKMLDTNEYMASLYYATNPLYPAGSAITQSGPDLSTEQKEYNLQNYFNRIKNLNTKIEELNETLIPVRLEYVELSAQKNVQENLRDAANASIEQVTEEFRTLTGSVPENIASSVDTTASNVQKLLVEYATYLDEYNKAVAALNGDNNNGLMATTAAKEAELESIQETIDTLKEHKKALNKLFFAKYSRFIQEGTWMSEEYIDDDKYYIDAQSVMYNSCYPQVAYTINVLALNGLPEYQDFDFDLGDKTYAIDPDFFGDEQKTEVVVSQISNTLDDPTKDVIQVQNFKNQFQDLFQKITATVQQTQYSTGAYEKAVALAEADARTKSQFLEEAFTSADARFSAAGQTTVEQGADGITLTDEKTKDQMRLIGGAILMSVQDENGQRKWKTGLTPDGISASLVTAGTINTGNISIMNGNDITFRLDALGMTALDVNWTNGGISGTTNKHKFVRFDKFGIYGINSSGNTAIDGTTWVPSNNQDMLDKATFALTWEGLKVTGATGAVALIGRQTKSFNIPDTEELTEGQEIQSKDYIMIVKNSQEKDTFRIDAEGNVEIGGNLYIGDLDSSDTIQEALVKTEQNINASVQGKIDQALIEAEKAAKDLVDALEDDLKEQIDKKIDTWFYEGEPTIDNKPAIDWFLEDTKNGNNDVKDSHIDDLYYDTKTNYAYRWAYDTETEAYKWIQISDESAIEALEAAAKAQATADGKMTVFVDVPKVLYKEGDLWVNATYDDGEYKYQNDLLRCKNSRTEGSFSIEDWELATKYTDDSVLQNFLDNDYKTFVEDIQNQIDSKATSYYQNSDPAIYTGTERWGANQVGNLWRCTEKIQSSTSTSNNVLLERAKDSEWVWKKISDNEYGWHEMEIPNNVFDAYDGKATIFTSQPKNYKEKDLWILSEKTTVNNKEYPTGYILIAKRDGSEYSANDWEEKISYTNDETANNALNAANAAQKTANDAVPAIVNGTYSWIFDKSAGLQIWNGSGEPNKDNIIFQITKGSLWMKGTGSFTGELHAGTPVNGHYPFNVDKDGNVIMNGGITLGGNITWSSSSSPTQALYNAENKAKPSGLYKDFVDGTNGWHKTQGTRRYASYTYDGGNTWGEVIQIVGIDGATGTPGTNGRDGVDGAPGKDGTNGRDGVDGKDGATGAPGKDGTNGRGIVDAIVTYAVSDSGTSAPGSGWQSNVPSVGANQYLWTRTYTTYTDGVNPTVSYSVAKRGEQGPQGPQGATGTPGKNGSDATVNRTNIVSAMLDAKANDGIYTTTINGVQCIGINASAIKTGEITVADKFYAKIGGDSVKIGAWEVKGTSLYTSSGYGSSSSQTYLSNTGISQKGFRQVTDIKSGLPYIYYAPTASAGNFNADNPSGTCQYELRFTEPEIGGAGSVPTPGFVAYLRNGYTDGSLPIALMYNNNPEISPSITLTYNSGSAIDIQAKSVTINSGAVALGNTSYAATLYGSTITLNGSTSISIGRTDKPTSISGSTITLSGQVTCGGKILPSSDGKGSVDGSSNYGGTATYMLGTKEKTWSYLYCGEGYFRNYWHDSSWSDVRLKNSIEEYSEQYELFFDKMRPVRYKYIEGTSDRYHTGFIAQELLTALEQADLTTKDFAGMCLVQDANEEGEKIGESYWALRRDEFVSLNTWQIQKLKSRTSTIEEKLLAYESRIKTLETQLQNLQNS